MRAVFLDRDGVLNKAVVRDGRPYPPASVSELEVLRGVPEGLASLKEMGFLLIVVTNQPDVGRGTQTREAVEAIHAALQRTLPIDDFFTCYHDDADHCDCRKPLPGLILQAAAKHAIDLSQSFMIGDRWRDIESGVSAGCETIWIDYGYSEQGPLVAPDARVICFSDAARWISEQPPRHPGMVTLSGHMVTNPSAPPKN